MTTFVISSLNPLTFLGSALSPSCTALNSNEWGVVSVLEDAIMLCGNCSSSSAAVWLCAKVKFCSINRETCREQAELPDGTKCKKEFADI